MKKNDHMPAASCSRRINLGMVIVAILSIFAISGLYSLGQADAAITNINQFGNTPQPCIGSTGGTTSNITCTSPTISAGSSRVLVLVIVGEAGGNHSSVTVSANFGTGRDFVEVQNSYGTNNNRRYAWIGYIDEAKIAAGISAGSNLAASVTSNQTWAGIEAYFAVYDGVDQGGGTSTVPGSTQADSSATTTTIAMGPITSVANGAAIYASSENSTGPNGSAPTNYTSHVNTVDSTNNFVMNIGSRVTTPGTTESVSYTSSNNRWTAVFMSLAPAASCLRSAPSVTISPSSQNVTRGTSGSYTLTVTNSDDVACAASTFNLAWTNTPGLPNSNFSTTGQAATIGPINPGENFSTLIFTHDAAAGAATNATQDTYVNASDANHGTVASNTVTSTAVATGAPGITVNPTSGLTTTEAGGTAQFTIVLDSAPTSNVTIGLSSSITSEGAVAPTSVTFTSANWSTPQTLTITGVDDAIVDGNIAYTIVTAAATSADGNYSGLNASDVSVTNLDNDGVPPAVPVGNWPMFILVIVGMITYGLTWRRKQGRTNS